MWNEDAWRFINTFAPWLSGIGSLSAVILSLWLLRRDKFIRLVVESTFVETNGSTSPPALRVTITNVGIRKANVTEIYTKTGVFRTKRNVPPIRRLRGAPDDLPKSLDDGDQVMIHLPLEAFALNLKVQFNDTPWWQGGGFLPLFLRTVKLDVRTSTGESFKAALPRSGRDSFWRYLRLAGQSI